MKRMDAIGHIGTEPTINTVGEKKVVNFSVAENATFKNKAGVKETVTTWIKCDFWNCSDALLPYLTKGAKVFISGKPHVEVYVKPETGEAMANQCLSVRDIELVSSKKEG